MQNLSSERQLIVACGGFLSDLHTQAIHVFCPTEMLVLFGSCHHQTVNRNVQDIRYRQHYVSGQDNMQQQHNK